MVSARTGFESAGKVREIRCGLKSVERSARALERTAGIEENIKKFDVDEIYGVLVEHLDNPG
jgi:hypothetical protein